MENQENITPQVPTEQKIDNTNVIKTPVVGEMKKSFIAYAMAVNVSRAIPDVRDGLKPVHRRILYSMSELNLFNDKPYRKCARIVGDVLGKYHPHGDSAVYDALVRLAQPFTMRAPLVDGQGNFGSIDGDPAAAQRYTEARLSKIASEMLRDLDKDCVDMVPNFDDTLMQPAVLPSRYPNLLVNGADGIAVGMATAIPPHNLGEVIDGVIALINNPDIEIDDLMTYIKAPDFPTGALIMGRMGIRQAYKTGHGKIVARARTEIEDDNGKIKIVVTEIPYQVNKAQLILQIANLVRDKKIEGIADIKEESDRTGMRIVIDLKRDANPQVVLNLLFKHSQLQTSTGIIFLALVNGEPKVLNLKEMLYYYLEHQKEVITRRTQYDLERAKERAHIVEGLVIALANIDEVIQVIKSSKERNDALEKLCTCFSLSDKQANAILDMRLSRLTALEVEKLQQELADLRNFIAECEGILADPNKVLAIIAKELTEIKEKYNTPRRSEISHDVGNFDIEDLIAKEDMVISMTNQGYLKRMALSEYHTQNRGGVGISTHKSKDNDKVSKLLIANTHDTMLFFTNLGKVYSVKTYEIPEGSKVSKGRNIINLLQVAQGEQVSALICLPAEMVSGKKSVYPPTTEEDVTDENLGVATENVEKEDPETGEVIDDYAGDVNPNGYLVFTTRNGLIKKTPVEQFFSIMRSGKRAISLDEGDELIKVERSSGNDDYLIACSSGKCIRFNERRIRPLGRAARGVRAMRLLDGAVLVDMCVVQPDKEVLTITANGYGKRADISEYRLQARGGIGVKAGEFNEKTGEVVGLRQIETDDDVILITNNGTTIRIKSGDVRKVSRTSQGVRMMKLRSNNSIVSMATVASEANEPEEEDGLPSVGDFAAQFEEQSEAGLNELEVELDSGAPIDYVEDGEKSEEISESTGETDETAEETDESAEESKEE
ncbi:MAG: DNA gyrase subunit A [Clostridia bacterium]|nr:DNA gyrase subunit A [Clostridia bacterium]